MNKSLSQLVSFYQYSTFLLICCMLIRGGRCKSQTVVINEIMQSNVDYLMVDNDFPDSWVELFNLTDDDIDLNGYYLGENNDVNNAFRLSETCIIQSKGYTVIYCDKTNNGLHTSFRIESGKGDIFLFDNDGVVIDSLSFNKMPAPNIALGRVVDGGDEWQYEILPTAGSRNYCNGTKIVLPDPIFSIKGGIFNTTVNVIITMPEVVLPEDTRLYVTTDGKEPDESSMAGNSFSFEISESTVIRAKLMSKEAISQRSITHSYIYHHRQTTIPIISMVSDADYFYSDEYGILKGGDNDKTTNCYQGWRRPVNVEFFDNKEGNKTLFNQLCETMVAGNYSRAYPQKSLKLYAHKRWGTKYFDGPLWDDKPDVNRVKSFMLRNGGTACLYGRINDAVIQKAFGIRLKTLDWQAYQPVILYVNGNYAGVYNMRERSNEDYVESNYRNIGSIEIHENPFISGSDAWGNTLYQDFYNVYMDSNVTYDQIENIMDVDNFMDTFIVEMFSTNYDYPDNNISIWRSTSSDGKWRWILKDLDYAGLRKPVTYNMFDYMFRCGSPDSEEWKDAMRWSSIEKAQELYIRMMSFPLFREMFIDRFSVFLGDFLKPSSTTNMINNMSNEIFDELIYTYNAYEDNCKWFGKYEGFYEFDDLFDPVEHYKKSIEELVHFWEKRPRIIYEQMADFFDLGQVINLTISTEGCEVYMNDILLLDGDFDGCYYSDRELKVSTRESDCSWELQITHIDSERDIVKIEGPEVNILLKNYQKDANDSVNVCLRLMKKDSINSIKNDIKDDPVQVFFNISGLIYNERQQGIIIRKQNDKFIKVFEP